MSTGEKASRVPHVGPHRTFSLLQNCMKHYSTFIHDPSTKKGHQYPAIAISELGVCKLVPTKWSHLIVHYF